MVVGNELVMVLPAFIFTRFSRDSIIHIRVKSSPFLLFTFLSFLGFFLVFTFPTKKIFSRLSLTACREHICHSDFYSYYRSNRTEDMLLAGASGTHFLCFKWFGEILLSNATLSQTITSLGGCKAISFLFCCKGGNATLFKEL